MRSITIPLKKTCGHVSQTGNRKELSNLYCQIHEGKSKGGFFGLCQPSGPFSEIQLVTVPVFAQEKDDFDTSNYAMHAANAEKAKSIT